MRIANKVFMIQEGILPGIGLSYNMYVVFSGDSTRLLLNNHPLVWQADRLWPGFFLLPVETDGQCPLAARVTGAEEASVDSRHALG